MYPRLFITQENNNSQLLSQYYIPEENKKLCVEICGVSFCLTFVCIVYFIFFLNMANDEKVINFTIGI